MATVTTPPKARNLADSHRRVRHPLERLRKYIRTYVSLEGAAVLLLYLALWFWIGLILDYGFFKAFTIDWVQELPWGLRCGVLVVLLSGLLAAIATKVVTRLFREFRDAALALVLERRFPKLLGDRLITAVELADTRKAAEQGYSEVMVRETIHEAAERVETLPLKQVFDWRRLIRQGVAVALLTVGCYLLAGAGFCAVQRLYGGPGGLGGFTDLNDVSGIWFERNVLLQNTIWPRRAHLEFIEPAAEEVRIGKGSASPTVRVRALKYVIAGAPEKSAVDGYHAWLTAQKGETSESVRAKVEAFGKKPPEGWRALTWFDLTPRLLGADVPDVKLPTDWEARNRAAGLTLDEIELNLDKEETHATLTPDAQKAFRAVLTQLDVRAAQPEMKRRLRKLEVPQEVYLIYKSKNKSSRDTLSRTGDNEYSGQFGELKESVTYTVQGLDYYTAKRRVTVVDPPMLDNLQSEEERPAYLYYRPGPGVTAEELRGRRQRFAPVPVSVQGGETSRIDVPAGTTLVLKAHCSKPLREAPRLVPRKAGVKLAGARPELLEGNTGFRCRFEDVRQEQDFLFEFVDTDGVSGSRHVLIRPAEDVPPRISGFKPNDIIRQVKDGYMVSVKARIPFEGKVADDHGLTDLRYAYTISRVEPGVRVDVGALLSVSTVPLFVPGGGTHLLGAAYLFATTRDAARQAEAEARSRKVEYEPASGPLPLFATKVKESVLPDKRRESIPLRMVTDLLAVPQKSPYRPLLREFDLKPDNWVLSAEDEPLDCDFPLWKKGLAVADPSRPQAQAQPRYRMELWLLATDTDLEGSRGPHQSPSAEKYTFLIVSELELMVEIIKAQEGLYDKLSEVNVALGESQERVTTTTQDLSDARVKAEFLGPMSIRTEKAQEGLEGAQRKTKEVYNEYDKILREMKANQVSPKAVKAVENDIVRPLGALDGDFETARDLSQTFRQKLDDTTTDFPTRLAEARKAGDRLKEHVRQLKLKLDTILAGMTGLTDINKQIKDLREIEEKQERQGQKISAVKEDVVRRILEGVPGAKDQ